MSFAEAETVFLDLDALDAADLDHSDSEPRYVHIGWSSVGRLLVVMCTVGGTQYDATIRIISARRAAPKERAHYAARRRVD